ncbi:MAG: glycosyltransferase family 2 protein [Proteobacteria bacterium]|nr:glycosyltransferase family 2 protein [Pseudomonadota bacterium]
MAFGGAEITREVLQVMVVQEKNHVLLAQGPDCRFRPALMVRNPAKTDFCLPKEHLPCFPHAPREETDTRDDNGQNEASGGKHQLAAPNMPRLSILLSTKNHARWLHDCIECILAQNFRDFEFLIRDDGSSDETPVILAEWAKKDSRIKFRTHEFSLGVMTSYRSLIEEASGEYLWLTASDDYVHDQHFLERGFKEISRHPGIGGFFSNCCRICAETGDWDGWWGWLGFRRILKGHWILGEYQKGRLTIPGASLIMNKSYFQDIGYYKKEAGTLADLLAGLELAMAKGIIASWRFSITIRVFKNIKSAGTSNNLNDQIKSWAYFESTLRKNDKNSIYTKGWAFWRAKILMQETGQRVSTRSKGFFDQVKKTSHFYSMELAKLGIKDFHITTEYLYDYLLEMTSLKEFLNKWKRSILKRLYKVLFLVSKI